ncbi:Crp/Fnr family transcriptional regulator [Sphingomonas sp. HF-S4]|uniref:Crp/Fnr family transcriptional regulator n=1 Tax=Sphingomonas agrestis TaxID=3080540 RepID=A0ABU3Y6V4_9SPHN|nr:Crp/Fnr family transcriptional regulator [Sphingomonas sp. HF-S4]MDV3457158.1 Crp/Fnr family transcriptional regulator [Sphingomonas sp. HF-S4]
MIEKHLMKLRIRDAISAEEEAALAAAAGDVVRYAADQTFVTAGQELGNSTLLLEGLICRYKDLSDGQRQITALHVPGDFPDLHSFTLKYLDHNIMALTPCTVVQFPHARLQSITEQHPHLTRMLWFMTNLDAAIHREWEVSLGRRSALERTAHLLCELHVRLSVVGLASDREYALPITQTDLAECLGLTSVHVNRVLKDLRERGLVEFRGGKVVIGDLAELRRAGEFDPAYLYLERRPR